MTNEQALHTFYSKFAKAYDENTVPDNAVYPRITYEVAEAEFDSPIPLRLRIWDRGNSWNTVTDIKNEIEKEIGMGGILLETDKGKIWLVKGVPFAQRTIGSDDTIRCIYINLMAEYWTA